MKIIGTEYTIRGAEVHRKRVAELEAELALEREKVEQSVKYGFIALAIMCICLIAVSVVVYRTGVHNGRRQMAKHIQNIRQLERINALAPRDK